jgi:hypothetical protein
MDEEESVDATAEYATLKEFPQEANISWLKKKISQMQA